MSDNYHHITTFEKNLPFSGYLRLFLGPMFAGKSTAMISCVNRYKYTGKNVLFIKHNKDNRYSHDKISNRCIVTHDHIKQHATSCTSLLHLFDTSILDDINVIGIDEGQFFEDLYKFIEIVISKEWNLIVIIAALDGDYNRKPFGDVLNLIPLADEVEKLTAICMECKNKPAPFTKRYSNETQKIVIGGKEKYKAVCHECYWKK